MDPFIFYTSLAGLWILAFGSGLVLLLNHPAEAGTRRHGRRP
ncbi:MAG: hypothetical protein U1F33_14735 [Alphaproteobacteria bacterium]